MVTRIVGTTLLVTVWLTGCGATQSAVQPTPVVVTQIVTQVVKETVVVTATPRPATATPTRAPATATTTPAPEPTTLATGKWQIDNSTSSFDDSATVVLALDADNTITPFAGDPIVPTLIIRCQEKALEAYIYTGTAADVEASNLDGATVRVRYDKDEPKTVNMGLSTSNDSLFFPDAARIVKSLLDADQMLFEFTPFNSAPVQMTFNTQGFTEAVHPLREACPNTP